MKPILIVGSVALLNINLNFLPTGTLLVVMGVTIILDFISGIIKAAIQNRARTSEGYRKTVVKFIQYGGALCVSIVLKYLSVNQGDSDMKAIAPFLGYLNDGLLFFIVFIEITSILENLYAIDKRSPMALYIIKPLLRIMTFAIKNNSFVKEMEEQEAKEKAK